ncbi:MAG: mechanosensitive ion channel family protein [Calditrichaeota bacterium]|nr:MAG: mechanosensitive ion channel family protein [Calditrichota bacterium]MBL1205567.1 mechanosensitive ion channel family protein [Calditrichota bacterium]NOG45396.1 mechanosensitive ion channel [Calditrichota bacterium]
MKEWLGEYAAFGNLFLFIFTLAVAGLVYIIVKKIVLKIASKLIHKTKVKFDDYILESKVFERLTLIVPVIIFYNTIYLFPGWQDLIDKLTGVLIALIISRALTSLFTGLTNYYSTLDIAKTRPIKGYVQVINLLIYLIAFIFIIGLITGESPWELLAGLGALTAVLLLIFRDTILSFVASLQIASNDLVHVGDWIEMRKFGADGDVIDIALHTIKVQNWDKTITVIPTYKIIDESFKNWRGMTAAGGRRIKRAFYVDLNSISFCTEDMLARFEKIELISSYVKTKREELASYNQNTVGKERINQRRLTNIGTFRIYVETFIKAHPKVHKNLTCMVRQLAPGPHGVPLEVYLFTNDIEWINYEAIQADIFDHIFAIVPEFDLRMYQQPSGQDMSRIQFIPSEA